MDTFLSAEDIFIKRRVRDYFSDGAPGRNETSSLPPAVRDPGPLLKELGFSEPHAAGRAGELGLASKALIIEGISRASPRLGRGLIPAGNAEGARSGAEEVAARTAWSIGSAAAILDACLKAARDEGLFGSTLMDHQKEQVALGELLSGLEAARLQAYRALRLIDRGRPDCGGEELERASDKASELRTRAAAMASKLLDDRVRAEIIPENERSRS
jgi:alkylation response protein AidB-like acyl-CoA dehydrogenase